MQAKVLGNASILLAGGCTRSKVLGSASILLAGGLAVRESKYWVVRASGWLVAVREQDAHTTNLHATDLLMGVREQDAHTTNLPTTRCTRR